MKGIWRTLVLFLVLAVFVVGCREEPLPCCNKGGELRQLDQAPEGFPPIEFPDDNAFAQARWDLGKKLFFDPVLSRDSSLSCGSCHIQSLGFADDRAFSPGIENRPGTRNAPGLANMAYHPYLLREGSVPTLEMQVLVPIQEANEFDHNIVDISLQLQTDSIYVTMSQAAYQRNPDPFVITRALGVFQRTLVSGGSPYDQWKFQGCEEALNPKEFWGMELFFSNKTKCSQCHNGFNFTNYAFENNGLYQRYEDPGRMRFTNDPADESRFKVPSLRNSAVTAPYMHDGSIASLEEVVEHYVSGGADHPNKSSHVQPLELSNREKEALVAFLRSLTDTEFLTDTRFQ